MLRVLRRACGVTTGETAEPGGMSLITLKEAAAHLGCSVRTLQRRERRGELAVFRNGHLVRIDERELTRYVAEHTKARPAAAPRSSPATRTRIIRRCLQSDTPRELPPGPSGGKRRVVKLFDLAGPFE